MFAEGGMFSMVERYVYRGSFVRKDFAGRVLGSAYMISQERALREFERRAHAAFRINRGLRMYTDTATGISLMKY